MVSDAVGLLSASLLCMVWLVESHVRLVCPRPASVRSDISFTNQSMGYCGVDMSSEFDKEHTEIRPGLFTIRFEETKFHRNSPYRVSVHDIDSEDYCVLLDHIPHNNHALFSDTCSQKGNEYPLGICEFSNYYVTVNIPDIVCDRCYLQVTHILLDSSEKMPCELDNGTCTGYVSCANIKIRPSVVGEGKNISSCSRYEDNLAGNWPFRPQEYYSVDVAIGQDKVVPMVMYDSTHRTLNLDIPAHGYPSEIDEVQVLMNDSMLWNVSVNESQRQSDSVLVSWQGMDDDSVQHLQSGHLILSIRCKTYVFEGNITLQSQEYSEGKYVKTEKTEYSKDGWLADNNFRGVHVEDMTVVTAAGPCAPPARHFISFLHPGEDSKFRHGILVASIMGDSADITVAMYNIKDHITDITIRGSELLGAPDLKVPVPAEKNNIFQVSLDVSEQTPFLDTVQFLKTVEVKTANPSMGLSGNFEEGMYSILRDGRDIKGIGAFQFTRGQWLKYEVLITGLESHVYRIELTGDKGVAYNLSDSLWHLDSGFCLVEGLIHDLSSKLVLQLWQERLLLTAYTNTSTLQGLVTAPGSVYCQKARDTACFFVDITPNAQPVTQLGEEVPPSGQAVFLLDSTKVLQYSIDVKNVKGHPRQLIASVSDGDDLVFRIKLAPDQYRAATYTATSHLQVSADMLQKLSNGNLKLEVSIQPTPLRGFLPPIKDHLCVQPKNRIVGDHRGYWSKEAAPFQTMFAIVGDSLVFKYEGNISLFSFKSKEAYQTCNFTSAEQLGPEVVNDTQVTYIVRLDYTESLYFASQDQCNTTPALKMAVNVIQAVPQSVRDSTDKCGSMVFAEWRHQKLDAFSGPEPTGPAIAGLVLGILIALAFCFWDRRLRQKADIAVPGSRFQRF